jgi:aldehyde:ferredoxin oxidoreductase
MVELKLLNMNLSDGSFKDEIINDETLRNYVGGRGLGIKLLYERTPNGLDALGPENIIFILTGPATGTQFPLSGRHHIIAKSPATGGIGESNSGGNFGAYLRRTGYDGIVIHGMSDTPVYLTLIDGEPKLHDAKHLWGKGVSSTEDIIRKNVGENKAGSVLCIGPAGEKLALIAGVMNDKHRAAGRTGLGAVFGSKKLKAIYVKPFMKPKIYDEEKLNEIVKEKLELIRNDWTCDTLNKTGTMCLVNVENGIGAFPTRNFATGIFPNAEKISGETLAEKYLTDTIGCWGCIIRCGRVTKVSEMPNQVIAEGPEYESTFALGADCGIDDLAAIVKANAICNDMGLDTISFGATVATTMELYEKGKIPIETLEGLEPIWGNSQAIVELAWKTGYRTGIGDDISMGAKRIAEKYGIPEIAMQEKGLEFPAYDPRAMQGIGLGYATSNRGGCHLRAYIPCDESFAPTIAVPNKLDPLKSEGKPKRVIFLQNFYAATVDSLVTCKFSTFALSVNDFIDLINPLTGWNWSVEESLKVGERIYNLERKFNIREGVKGDTLPKRLLETPMPEGPAKGYTVNLKPMLKEYYELRGWVDGIPTKEKLEELGIPS